MKAMILSAGLGTRLKPWTDHHPKALAIVNGKSLLQRNVEYLQQAGIYEVIINVHHFADQIIDAVQTNKGWGSRIQISDETNEVLETGGGLKKAAAYFNDGDFLLMNVDILTTLDLKVMLSYHKSQQPLATIAISDRKTSRYFLFDQDNTLRGWKNVKTGETKLPVPTPNLVEKAFSGIHMLNPSIFNVMKQQGKFSMVDVYLDLVSTHTIKGFEHTNSKFIDVGKPESIKEAEALFA